jgi:hypothetical protein
MRHLSRPRDYTGREPTARPIAPGGRYLAPTNRAEVRTLALVVDFPAAGYHKRERAICGRLTGGKSVRNAGRRRRSRYDFDRGDSSTRVTVALFVGALVLLLASGGLIAAMLRQDDAPRAAAPTPSGTAVIAVATPRPTDVPPPTVAPAAATGTARPPTVTVTARPATATAPTSSAPGSPTRLPTTTTAGGCAVAIPKGFTEERAGSGYYPADDKSGFIALDPFATNGGQRSTADLAQGYIEGTLKLALQDFRQTASLRTDEGSRIEYTASAGGKTGRGVVVVRRIGEVACGVTLFVLEGSPIPFDQTLDALLSSLQPSRP